MKIILPEPSSVSASFYGFIAPELRAMGHEVTTVDPDYIAASYGVEIYGRYLCDLCRRLKPDLMLTFPPYDMLSAEQAAELRKLTRLVGFAYDDQIFIDSYNGHGSTAYDAIRDYYDVYFTTSPRMVAECQQRGLTNVQHLKWAICTPTEPIPDRPRDLDVVLIGQAYPRRVEMVKALKAAGVPLSIFGSDSWKQYPEVADLYQGYLTLQGMDDIYQRAKIAISPSDWECNYVPMVKLRTLEIARCGPLQIIEYSPEVADYFNASEVSTFEPGNWTDLVAKVKAALTNVDACQVMGERAMQRAVTEHNWRNRWKELKAHLKRVSLLQLLEQTEKPAVAAVDEMLQMSIAVTAELTNDAQTSLKMFSQMPVNFTTACGVARAAMIGSDMEGAANVFAKAKSLYEPRLMDLTTSFRKVGKPGLGRLLAGMFPLTLECDVHLLVIFAMVKAADYFYAKLAEMATNPDHLVSSVLLMLSELKARQQITGDLAIRMLDTVLAAEPSKVWQGERNRHAAHLHLMRGQEFLRMGQRSNALDAFGIGLSLNPPPLVHDALLKELRALEVKELISPDEAIDDCQSGSNLSTLFFTGLDGAVAVMDPVSQHASQMQADSPACDICGSITVRSGTCYKCLNCGNSIGCS